MKKIKNENQWNHIIDELYDRLTNCEIEIIINCTEYISAVQFKGDDYTCIYAREIMANDDNHYFIGNSKLNKINILAILYKAKIIQCREVEFKYEPDAWVEYSRDFKLPWDRYNDKFYEKKYVQ